MFPAQPIEGTGTREAQAKVPVDIAPAEPAPSQGVNVEKTLDLPQGEKVTLSSQPAKAIGAPPEPEEPSSEEKVAKRLSNLIDEISRRATSVQFTVDGESENLIVKVVNKETGEIVRQIPPDEMIHLGQQIAEMRGILFSKTS